MLRFLQAYFYLGQLTDYNCYIAQDYQVKVMESWEWSISSVKRSRGSMEKI